MMPSVKRCTLAFVMFRRWLEAIWRELAQYGVTIETTYNPYSLLFLIGLLDLADGMGKLDDPETSREGHPGNFHRTDDPDIGFAYGNMDGYWYLNKWWKVSAAQRRTGEQPGAHSGTTRDVAERPPAVQ